MKFVALGLILSAMAIVPAQAAGDPAAGEKVFKRCASCHAVGEGAANKVGPELNELFGRTAGSLADYNYSDAMKQAGAGGLVWAPDTLGPYLHDPKGHVPGTKMSFPGLKKDKEVDDVIAYLGTFSPNYVPAAPADGAAPAAPADGAAPAAPAAQ